MVFLGISIALFFPCHVKHPGCRSCSKVILGCAIHRISHYLEENSKNFDSTCLLNSHWVGGQWNEPFEQFRPGHFMTSQLSSRSSLEVLAEFGGPYFLTVTQEISSSCATKVRWQVADSYVSPSIKMFFLLSFFTRCFADLTSKVSNLSFPF